MRSRAMHRYFRWLKPSDRPILLEFRDYGPNKWLTSKAAALNLPYTANHVARRLRTLYDHGFVDAHPDARAAYRITDRGITYLADELSVAEVESNER